MVWLVKRSPTNVATVFVIATVLAAVFYFTTRAGERPPPLLPSGIRTTTIRQQYDLQYEQSAVVSSSIPPRPPESEDQPPPRGVAICLVGGLRSFELTGPSIRKHLLDIYEDADVFVHAPVDADVHKLTLLMSDGDGAKRSGPRLASAKLFQAAPLNESLIAQKVLSSNGSPNGIQGLLQYFNLVEGCWDMIEEYEARRGFQYEWVIRSRVDSYWNGPMPRVEGFNSSRYYVPEGSDFRGLNDRLGVGSRETSRVGLRRMSLLPEIYEHGYRDLNSEKSFKAQFDTNHVDVEPITFPFCVLSKRKYRWVGARGIPVISILNKTPLNGAKCRPCKPAFIRQLQNNTRPEQQQAVGGFNESKLIEKIKNNPLQLCDAHSEWDRNWEQIFDAAAGPEMAEVRLRMASRSAEDCVRDMDLFQQQWDVWTAPSAEELCPSAEQ